MFLNQGFFGVSSGKGGVAAELFIKKDGDDAIFANTGARDAYFQSSPDELKKVGNHPVGIGTANAITAAYVYDKKGSKWVAVATNFKGDKGGPGAAGRGVNDLSAIPDNHVPTVVGGKVVDSGIEAQSGSMAVDSVYLGIEKLSGSGETLLITNTVEGITRSPLYQTIGPDVAEGFVRESGPEVTLNSGGSSSTTTNPDYTTPATNNAILLKAEFNFAAPMSNVTIKLYRGVFPKPAWELNIGTVTTGKHLIDLKLEPLVLKGGIPYRVTITSPDGDVQMKSGTRGKPYSSIIYSIWRDVPIATKEWVQAQLGGSPAHVPSPIINSVIDVKLDGSGNLDIYHSNGSVTKLTLPQSPSAGATVTKVALDVNKNLAVTYSDGTTSTIPVGDKTSNVGAFVYYGKAMPTYPAAVQSGYFVSLYAMQGAPELPAPTASQPIPDGTMFLVSNKDINTSIKVTGLSFGAQTIGPDSVAWFVAKSGKWELVFVGYIISSFKTLYSDIKRELLADKSFRPATPTKVEFVNPDGTKFDIDELKLVGLEVVDPGNGDPLKLTILNPPVNPKGGGDNPVLQLPRIYAMFSLSTPTSLSGAVTSTNGKVTLHRIPTTRSRVFVLVENDNNEASKVKGISVNGGWAAAWQPRDTVIDGKKYRAFYSAGAYSEKTLDITVNFG
ncbi:hypothetical protein NVP1205O_43 [Vibrio phage 1.205.O._10N.222.51.A7]|nr:hypothetical protein NVP1205O_43 [Vibrio phage 1.205.O._10N.222.51.A7]